MMNIWFSIFNLHYVSKELIDKVVSKELIDKVVSKELIDKVEIENNTKDIIIIVTTITWW